MLLLVCVCVRWMYMRDECVWVCVCVCERDKERDEYVWGCGCGMCMAWMWRSEDNFWELVPSFHPIRTVKLKKTTLHFTYLSETEWIWMHMHVPQHKSGDLWQFVGTSSLFPLSLDIPWSKLCTLGSDSLLIRALVIYLKRSEVRDSTRQDWDSFSTWV